MKETLMVVTDLLEHNPGRSLIEILYLSSKMPYHTMAKNLCRNGYSILVLPDDEVERRAIERLRRHRVKDDVAGDNKSYELPYEAIQRACTPAYLEFLLSLESRAKEDKKREEDAAMKAADEHAKKVEAARQEMIKACSEEEKLKYEHEKSVIQKQVKLQAYLDLLDERRNYQ